MTHEEALTEAETREVWLVDGIITATSTLIYGEAKVGKSFLASALIASLMSGEDFLGTPVPQDRDFSVAVGWTDDGGGGDYAAQINGVLPDTLMPKVDYYTLGQMGPEGWRAFFDEVTADGHNIVVIDNLTQCLTGSMNQDDVVRQFFDGVRLFTRAGIPVVIIGHSSDKAGANGYKPETPMGSAVISQSVRWRVFVKRSKKGNLTLNFSGNYAAPHQLTVKHGAGARFEVLAAKTADTLAAESEKRTRERSVQTLDQNRGLADWVVANCQGLGMNQAAKKAAESGEFPGLKEETIRSRLKATGAAGKMLLRSGTGTVTTWELDAA